jgi:myo-inositol 2-dehydrogenase/D-chiro-inositol 1-dehydrogenase
MRQRRPRLVVVGLGRIGRLHAANLSGRTASAELAGVVEPLEPLARSVGDLHGVPWSASLDRALDDADVDGVVIAAPTALHVELVELAAAAGKHVFCEKPLGFEVEEAGRAVAAAHAAGVHLQVGFQRRFDPDWLALSAALDGNELGELHLLRCSHRNAAPPAASLGDLFVDIAVHDLDAARWLGGEVVEVSARARPVGDGSAMAAGISVRFESGALGLIDVSRDAGYGFECSAELVGSRATARTGYGHPGVEVLSDGVARAPLPPDHAHRHSAAYVAELDHFGDLVVDGASPRATGEDAVAALGLALAAARSAATR